MNWRQFASALPLLARARGWTPQELVNLVAACPGPSLNSEAAAASGRQSSFTGRSGSFSGSRPASFSGGSRPASAAGASEDGDREAGGAGAERRGSGGSVGGFTPLRRPSSVSSAGSERHA